MRTKQIENCILGLWLMHDTHPSKVKLHTWTCGSAHCFGGWVAVSPEFRAQGVSANKHDGGAPILSSPTRYSWHVADKLFGDDNIFASRLGHDEDLWRHSDRKNVINRLEAQIERLTS
jgi:hypothetical protein